MVCKRNWQSDFWDKIEIEDNGCWIWTGTITNGYGTLAHDRAHTLMYRFAKGEIPHGYHIDHLCENKRCVNPDHLEAVTPQENTIRYMRSRRKKQMMQQRNIKEPLLTVTKVAIPLEFRDKYKKKIEERFVKDISGCWLWNGNIDKNGYGLLHTGGHRGRKVFAHRASYECFIGSIPHGLVLDHLCKNVSCVNPEHLQPVHQGTNARRGIAKIDYTTLQYIIASPKLNKEIAVEVGLDPSTICDIRKGNRWPVYVQP